MTSVGPARGARLAPPLLVGVFAGALAGVLAVGAVALAAAGPAVAKVACQRGRVCVAPVGAPELTTQRVWRSPAGIRAEYDRGWHVVQRGTNVLKLRDANVVLWLEAVPSQKSTLASLYQDRVQALRRTAPDLAEDDKAVHRLVGAEIGYVDGLGGVFRGALFRPPHKPVSALVLASRRGRVSVIASVTTMKADWVGSRFADGTTASDLFLYADLVLNSVRWTAA